MALYDYSRALKKGRKQYQSALGKGEYPYLPVLDDILSYTDIVSEVSLGLVDIPLDRIVGTKTQGRTNAFANNFMPLLGEKTEFGAKWAYLYDAQITEGIHDPILVYEFMNKFYVQEGNKRVSVLKYVNAFSIPGMVTRLIPKRSDDKENRLYYEFMDFYQVSFNVDVWFSEEGSYSHLLAVMGKKPGEVWDEDERLYFKAIYDRFSKVFKDMGGDELDLTVSDAFLVYAEIFEYEEIKNRTEKQIKADLSKIWDEFVLKAGGGKVALVETPEEMEAPGPMQTIRNWFLPVMGEEQKTGIAFIYDKTPETSGWIYGHELGRLHLDQLLPEEVSTFAFAGADNEDKVEEAIEQAIDGGCRVVFTTSPTMIHASVKQAILHPQIKILNCSVNTSYSSVRTYYGRMYEAKFLMGALAGALSESNKLGYVADYPIFGSLANVNAFAIGARMVNPRAEVYLQWKSVKNNNALENLMNSGAAYISADDLLAPKMNSREFGLFHHNEDGRLTNLATPIWHWGKFYEQIIETIRQGGWESPNHKENKAVNYWWGMSAGVIDIIYSQSLPHGTHRLVDFLSKSIKSGSFQPFDSDTYAQNGVRQISKDKRLTPEEIITMNWLAENVVGRIPEMDDLTAEAQDLVRLQGIIGAEEPGTEAKADENSGDRR